MYFDNLFVIKSKTIINNKIEINGFKRSGLNAASKSIPLQFDYLIQDCNSISNCFKGTIFKMKLTKNSYR